MPLDAAPPMLTKDAETLELPPSVRYPPIRHSRESGNPLDRKRP
jgi:hypothetical protein